MKSIKNVLTVVMLTILLSSCSRELSLQKYYVENSENPNFISLDIPANIISSKEIDLTPKQQEAYKTVEKLNVLAFQLKEDNELAYATEKKKVKTILQNDKYQELMRMNIAGYGGVIKYIGDDEAIDELIIFGNSNEKGFALVRVLGDNMTVKGIMQLIQATKNGKIKNGALKDFEQFFK